MILRRLATLVALGISLIITSRAYCQALTPPRQYSISPTNVNLLDSTYATTIEEISIGNLKLERSYLGGRETSSQLFGSGWTHNYDIRVLSHYGNGSNPTLSVVIGRTKYVFGGTATSNAPQTDEYGTTLTQVSGAYVFTDRDGTVYRFAAGANADATITAPDGAVTTITYVSSKPKLVRSNRGYAIVFDYGSNGAVSAACGFNLTNTVVTTSTTCASATLKTTYAYVVGFGGFNNLVGATNVLGDTAHYAYTTSVGGITCLTDPGTTACKVTNTYQPGQYHVTQQTMGDGTVWQFGCSCSFDGRDDSADPLPDDSSGWTDPSGHGMSFDYHGGIMVDYVDNNGQLYLTGSIGRYPTFVKLPETNSVAFGYTDRMMPNAVVFHAKSGSGLADIATSKTFPSSCSNPVTCNEPTSATDANGNVATYTYDSAHGGVLTETSPANSAGVSAVVRHAYAQKYAYIKNSGGTYSAASAPIWLRTEDRSCNTTATVSGTCAGGSIDEVVTAYDYGPASGPNNLLLRGKAVTAWDPVTSSYLTLRTCYTYDWMGNKISETSPRAGLASCS
jgi:YD repeat-containing protein